MFEELFVKMSSRKDRKRLYFKQFASSVTELTDVRESSAKEDKVDNDVGWIVIGHMTVPQGGNIP